MAELADRTLLEPGGWSVVVVEEARIDATTRMLEEELTFWIEEEGVGSVRVFSERHAAPALREELACMTPEDVALLPLSADVIVPVSRALDYERTRLSGLDLNPPGHGNNDDGLRSHLHLNADDDGLAVSAPVMSPFEILDLFLHGLRRVGRVRRSPVAGPGR
ncbi:hypothetical protein ACMHYB_32605 [Sorangium sp. So ce1128]